MARRALPSVPMARAEHRRLRRSLRRADVPCDVSPSPIGIPRPATGGQVRVRRWRRTGRRLDAAGVAGLSRDAAGVAAPPTDSAPERAETPPTSAGASRCVRPRAAKTGLSGPDTAQARSSADDVDSRSTGPTPTTGHSGRGLRRPCRSDAATRPERRQAPSTAVGLPTRGLPVFRAPRRRQGDTPGMRRTPWRHLDGPTAPGATRRHARPRPGAPGRVVPAGAACFRAGRPRRPPGRTGPRRGGSGCGEPPRPPRPPARGVPRPGRRGPARPDR
ncbi:hypothetical protein UA75_27585 [Actinoalloteichus sp. GBA129-24]|uniref:Uncharacterized protein n=1 Tax=Actinoalloteichus fjordicus TaxID=1612552 RepID=A0AAC9PU75_9PSEU|nr:hypothetical protein UA74_26995 [Actinoalloteichus fjordicus]APU23488.1 hypothetical protein UA75_27585 [Actinoalloteichus sp. GBA129-24]